MLQSQISAFQKRQEKVQALQAESAAAHQRSLKQQQAQQQAQHKDGKGPSEVGAGGPAQMQGRVLNPANWMQDKDYYTAKRDAQRAPLGMKIKKVIDLLFKVSSGRPSSCHQAHIRASNKSRGRINLCRCFHLLILVYVS